MATDTTTLVDAKYVLGAVIGCGGMGIVHSATQVALGRRVAIKIPRAELANDPLVIRRFKTEARAGGLLAHPNIARVIDFGGPDGAAYLVMEYVGGVPLETFIAEHGPMPSALAADVVGQILAALRESHAAGIVHADIKSANVLVEMLPSDVLLARVIDFGLAQFIDEPFVNADRLLSGTPEYLAPELINGGCPTVASDIYAAGVVLYELLTGTTPFGGGSSNQILTRHLDDLVIPPSFRSPDQDIPPSVERVVMRALAKEPNARFASAAQMTAALRSAVPAGTARSSRIARGTLKPVSSTKIATCDWHRDEVTSPRPVVDKTVHIGQVRRVLADALASGNGDSIVASYLDLVHLLVADKRLAAAAGELEHGLRLLKSGTLASSTGAATWRLQLCLAGVYSGLGDSARARNAARLGHDLAVNVSSELGQQGATELLARLGGCAKA